MSPLITALGCEQLHPFEGTGHSFVIDGRHYNVIQQKSACIFDELGTACRVLPPHAAPPDCA